VCVCVCVCVHAQGIAHAMLTDDTDGAVDGYGHVYPYNHYTDFKDGEDGHMDTAHEHLPLAPPATGAARAGGEVPPGGVDDGGRLGSSVVAVGGVGEPMLPVAVGGVGGPMLPGTPRKVAGAEASFSAFADVNDAVLKDLASGVGRGGGGRAEQQLTAADLAETCDNTYYPKILVNKAELMCDVPSFYRV